MIQGMRKRYDSLDRLHSLIKIAGIAMFVLVFLQFFLPGEDLIFFIMLTLTALFILEFFLIIPLVIIMGIKKERLRKSINKRVRLVQALDRALLLVQSEKSVDRLYSELDALLGLKATERNDKQKALVQAFTWVVSSQNFAPEKTPTKKQHMGEE